MDIETGDRVIASMRHEEKRSVANWLETPYLYGTDAASTALQRNPLPAENEHVRQLDGLRGIAVGLVLLSHCVVAPEQGGLAWLIRNVTSIGWTGVDIFFALSGYLIVRNLLWNKGQDHRFLQFYVSRILRIAPLYIGLILLVMMAAPRLGYEPLVEIWPYLTFTSNMWAIFHQWGLVAAPGGHPLLAHMWSLAVEAQLYIAIPFGVYSLGKRQLGSVLLLLLATAPLVRLWVNAQFGDGMSYFVTLGRLDPFCLGGLLAIGIDGRDSIRQSGARIVAWLTACSIICVAALWGMGRLNFSNPDFNLAGVSIVDLAAVLLVAAVIVQPNGWLSASLRTRPLAGLGRISYGVYVIHYPITLITIRYLRDATLVDGWWRTLAIAAVSVAGTLVLAKMAWWGIEERALRLKAALRAPARGWCGVSPFARPPSPR